MKILLIGSGGREHALAWKLQQSPQCEELYALPGNPGIARLATCLTDIGPMDNEAIVRLAKEKRIDLVVVGPEAPLVNGLADELERAEIKVFGPTKAAAALEGSKAFAKELMVKYRIPTAKHRVFKDLEAAKEYVKTEGAPIVVKADGLAAGKGVVVAEEVETALKALDDIMGDKTLGEAGREVVIEEFMTGEEASLLAFTDGKTVIPMVSAQDHKRAFDGDQGPNTGGMGTYAPAPVMTAELIKEAEEKILKPVVAAMAQEGRPYRGCLYAGLMITAEGPKVVEFNARFGDPETQVILPLLQGDLAQIMLACASGSLAEQEIRWSKESAVCVVLASGGYPGRYAKGCEINGLEDAEAAGALVFQAGTEAKGDKLLTAGGRVLNVTALGENIESAVRRAYRAAERISFKDMRYRKDIAGRALARLRKI